MSLSTIDHVQTTTRHERPSARSRLRNARRALALVTTTATPTLLVPTARDHAVRLHPVELGPWDD